MLLGNTGQEFRQDTVGKLSTRETQMAGTGKVRRCFWDRHLHLDHLKRGLGGNRLLKCLQVASRCSLGFPLGGSWVSSGDDPVGTIPRDQDRSCKSSECKQNPWSRWTLSWLYPKLAEVISHAGSWWARNKVSERFWSLVLNPSSFSLFYNHHAGIYCQEQGSLNCLTDPHVMRSVIENCCFSS